MGCKVTTGRVFSFEIVVGGVGAELSTGRPLVLVFGHFEFRLEGSMKALS